MGHESFPSTILVQNFALPRNAAVGGPKTTLLISHSSTPTSSTTVGKDGGLKEGEYSTTDGASQNWCAVYDTRHRRMMAVAMNSWRWAGMRGEEVV